jgi:DNA-directed RNA polymerase specialized sigma24 family protein
VRPAEGSSSAEFDAFYAGADPRLTRQLRATARPARLAAEPAPEHVALVAALSELSEKQRVALVLHYFADPDVALLRPRAPVTVASRAPRGAARDRAGL